jgi:hypothetical protein
MEPPLWRGNHMCEINSDSSDLTIEIKRSIDDAIDSVEDLGFLFYDKKNN